jgi:glycosyltransferase involved in cell wall biosynthesis
VKILFVPTESREIAQFSLIKPVLEAENHEVMAIALDRSRALDKSKEPLEALLGQRGYHYKPITDYKTKNMLKIIKKEKPDIIVTDWSGFTPNAIIYAANNKGIPCLQINDGITANYFAVKRIPTLGQSLVKLIGRAFRLLLFKANPRALAYLFTTLISIYRPLEFLRKMTREMIKSTYPISSYTEGLNIAVVSQFAKDAHINMGAPADKIFVTGQPRFDLIGLAKTDKRKIIAELGIPENKGIIVLATQPLGTLWTEKDREEFISTVVNALREFPEKQLVIKLHPGEKLEEYQKMLAEMDDNKAIVCQSIDLYGLLRACDILMTVHSTVALEAMILDKPVIILNLAGRPDAMPYAQRGPALGVYKKEDLVPMIRKALHDPEVGKELKERRERFVSEHAYKLDGQATKRVAELIIRLAEDSKKKGGFLT